MELLQRRKFCREFLNGYNEKIHPLIISRVFEIGLLTLKNNFNKLLFSKEELDEIIKSLSGKEYVEVVPLPQRKRLEKLENKKYDENLDKCNNNYSINKEQEEKNKVLKNKHMHRYFLENPNFTTQNNEIYPFWWWNNKEDNNNEIKTNTINNKINSTYGENNYQNNENFNEENNNNLYEEEEPREDIIKEQMNDNINNYSIKKLKNSSINQKPKEIDTKINILKHKKLGNKVNKICNKPRVKSSRIAQRNNNNINYPKYKKLNNYIKNNNHNQKNLNLQKVPKRKYHYNNGRIVKVQGETDMNMMNMTDPNNIF